MLKVQFIEIEKYKSQASSPLFLQQTEPLSHLHILLTIKNASLSHYFCSHRFKRCWCLCRRNRAWQVNLCILFISLLTHVPQITLLSEEGHKFALSTWMGAERLMCRSLKIAAPSLIRRPISMRKRNSASLTVVFLNPALVIQGRMLIVALAVAAEAVQSNLACKEMPVFQLSHNCSPFVIDQQVNATKNLIHA